MVGETVTRLTVGVAQGVGRGGFGAVSFGLRLAIDGGLIDAVDGDGSSSLAVIPGVSRAAGPYTKLVP